MTITQRDTKDHRSYHGDSPPLKLSEVSNRDKTLSLSNHSNKSQTQPRKEDVLGNELHSVYCLDSYQYLSQATAKLQCCSFTKVVRSNSKRSWTIGGSHDDTLGVTSQGMKPTNIVKKVDQNSLLHIESNLDRVGLLSPTHGQRCRQQNGQIKLQNVMTNQSNLLSRVV